MNEQTTRINIIDWDDAFDNSSYVPSSDTLAARWSAAASDFRTKTQKTGLADLDLAYGPLPRNQLDLFYPEIPRPNGGLIVFIHGGYWQKLDKSYWSHLAEALTASGWAVGVPSYSLAPAIRITAITEEIRSAIEFAASRVEGPIRLVGHSAGGHLATRMVCDDSGLSTQVLHRVQRVMSVSGIHDLRPLSMTRMNTILQLSEKEAISESPALHTPLPNVRISFWVGAGERPELIRQTRLIAEIWQAIASDVSDHYEMGMNHFSIIESLTAPQTALFKELTARSE